MGEVSIEAPFCRLPTPPVVGRPCTVMAGKPATGPLIEHTSWREALAEATELQL